MSAFIHLEFYPLNNITRIDRHVCINAYLTVRNFQLWKSRTEPSEIRRNRGVKRVYQRFQSLDFVAIFKPGLRLSRTRTGVRFHIFTFWAPGVIPYLTPLAVSDAPLVTHILIAPKRLAVRPIRPLSVFRLVGTLRPRPLPIPSQ